MSLAEMERYAADLRSDFALRMAAERAQADHPDGSLLSSVVAFAVSRGYRFTVEEAREVVRARSRAVGRELQEAELEGPVGGPCWYWSIFVVKSTGQFDFDHGRYWSLGPPRAST
ncbi:MAG: hypothetical protein LCH95_15925 [Proteobacteria bacterium]|nr:hypothetical protein [Pseudomonadota bacterium]